jgi:predicted transcriptional regulator
MSQSEVLKLLNDNINEEFTSKEISKILKKTRSSIHKTIATLIKWNLVNYEYRKVWIYNQFSNVYFIKAKLSINVK